MSAKKSLKRHLKISFIVTVLMYLIMSFVLWDITCITKLPSLDVMNRVMLVVILLAKEAFIALENETKLNL